MKPFATASDPRHDRSKKVSTDASDPRARHDSEDEVSSAGDRSRSFNGEAKDDEDEDSDDDEEEQERQRQAFDAKKLKVSKHMMARELNLKTSS